MYPNLSTLDLHNIVAFVLVMSNLFSSRGQGSAAALTLVLTKYLSTAWQNQPSSPTETTLSEK
jgi:hypothetical protein